MNFIKGRIENTGEGLSFLAGDRRLSLSRLSVRQRLLVPGQEVVLGIRPEHLEISSAGIWPGFTVDIVEPMGADTVIWCSDALGSLQVRTTGSRKAARGESMTLHVEPTADLALFGRYRRSPLNPPTSRPGRRDCPSRLPSRTLRTL